MRLTKTLLTAAALLAAVAGSACGRNDLGRSPSRVVVERLEGASGAEPDELGTIVYSDVITNVKRTVNGQEVEVPTVFADLGQVTLRVMLRDAGTTASPTVPTGINSVTFTRYHVSYTRTDGRNTPGIDVPYAFDGAFSFTVSGNGSGSASFELVRHVAKGEAPLRALINNPTVVSALATVTFYGEDLAGNEVVAAGSITVEFGNFGDPE